MPQSSIDRFGDDPPQSRQVHATTMREVRDQSATAETGCACPLCHRNIAPTHGDQFLPRTTVVREPVLSALAGVAVRVNGWRCAACGLVVPRDMERANTCWSNRTNGDRRFVGVLVGRDCTGSILAPVDRRSFRDGLPDEFTRLCPDCGREYGGCVTQAGIPCRPCRGGRDHRTWTKPWDSGHVRTKPWRPDRS